MMLNNQPHMHLNLFQRKNNSRKAEATSYLIGNKITNKITKFSKKSPQNTSETVKRETEIPRERYISPEERQKVINELRSI